MTLSKNIQTYNPSHISEIIAMAWDDEASFEAIESTFGLAENQVIELMRSQLKPGSFKVWRKRVSGRSAKHLKRSTLAQNDGECSDDDA